MENNFKRIVFERKSKQSKEAICSFFLLFEGQETESIMNRMNKMIGFKSHGFHPIYQFGTKRSWSKQIFGHTSSNSFPQIRYSSGWEAMDIFDRVAKRKQKDRAAASPTSKNFDFLREITGERLCERLNDLLRHQLPVALDLGCTTGILTKYLQDTKVGIQTLYQLDLSSNSLFSNLILLFCYFIRS